MKILMTPLPLFMYWLTTVSLGDMEPSILKRRYCGDRLTSTLQIMCNGVYQTVATLLPLPSGDVTEHQRSRREALQLTPRLFRRIRRGVYDECCRKACSVSELTSYCGEP